MSEVSRATPIAAVVASAAIVAAMIPACGPAAGAPRAPAEAAEAQGPGGPGGPGGAGFGPGTFLGPVVFSAADADGDGTLTPAEAAAAARRFIGLAEAGKAGSADARALARAINENIPIPEGFGPGGPGGPPGGGPPDGGPPGGGPPDGPPPGGGFPGGPGGPPGGGGPGGFGPGMFLAPQVVELADANKDGRVSADEAAAAAESFVREADARKQGSIDAGALARAMNRRMGPPPGFGPGGPMGEDRKIVKDFDKDGDGRLDRRERLAARESLRKDREKNPRRGGPPGFGPGGPGGPGGPAGMDGSPPRPGPRVRPADVPTFADRDLYDPGILRTLFLTFDSDDWEKEIEDFHGTDVDVPADLVVDGKTYRGVGVRFRGMSSYMMVQAGRKRSLNVSVDHTRDGQKLLGYKTLNLLNSHEDPTFLHTVLYSRIARAFLPAPKANLVRVVINGESWGVYVNAQQFDKVFLEQNFKSSKGARWKVPGNPGADGGLRYLGEDLEPYKQRFEMKSGGKADWEALVKLCKTLNQAPAGELESALSPMLDIDGALRFLALDNALINGDGYWSRASDYSLYRDGSGKFHLVPHDMNETFGPAMMFGPPGGPGGSGRGPGGSGGRRGGPRGIPGGPGGGPPGGGPGGPGGFGGPGRTPAADLDPLVGLEDERTPLRSRLLAVPALRARYLAYVRRIADEWLDWKTLGPIVAGYRTLIDEAIEEDTRKLSSTEEFRKSTADAIEAGAGAEARPRWGPPSMGLRAFADGRRAYLLDYLEKKGGVK
ncbi:Inner spore coat protein H [Aquisphaera giovannonii]|uniref:Inner spore coat protein H n=1 Tax=Aquisphaera giovannonii TaxID=406548 RepID=A0A5B9W3W6_9BACT|nr:CotH kinase family protein [Aquisphaera giovannonii]QEH34879.1 Inner spore coat protein H [Aquisphaera giovannonii]